MRILLLTRVSIRPPQFIIGSQRSAWRMPAYQAQGNLAVTLVAARAPGNTELGLLAAVLREAAQIAVGLARVAVIDAYILRRSASARAVQDCRCIELLVQAFAGWLAPLQLVVVWIGVAGLIENQFGLPSSWGC